MVSWLPDLACRVRPRRWPRATEVPLGQSYAAEEMRELENARLDRAQAAIWTQVLAGDYRAVMVFLQISQRRAKLNGLDSPAPVAISPNVRGEMERALADLQQLVLAGEVESVSYEQPD